MDHESEISKSLDGNVNLRDNFFDASNTDQAIKDLAMNMKKQDSVYKYLPTFVVKNGLPRWDKVVYKISNNNSSSRITDISNAYDEGPALFFIPIQSNISSAVIGYITAYRHNEQDYTYRIYNKDSLSMINAGSYETELKLLNTQVVIAYFERIINDNNEYFVSQPTTGYITDADLTFTTQNGIINGSSITSDCYAQITTTTTFNWEECNTLGGHGGEHWTISTSVDVVIFCIPTTEGGGSSGSSNPWIYGTGYPWGSGSNHEGHDTDPDWNWWWDIGDGIGGQQYNQVVPMIAEILNLNFAMTFWLELNPNRANEIAEYLASSTHPQKNEFALAHLHRMITDPKYLAFVETFSTSFPGMWWENAAFLLPWGGVNFGTWAIDYLLRNPNISFETFQNQFLSQQEGPNADFDEDFWNNPNNSFPPQSLPSWVDFEAAYPETNGNNMAAADVYEAIGGTVKARRDAVLNDSNPFNDNDYDNACALRMSIALNYSGVVIPHIVGQTYKGDDDKYYFFGAANMNKWMRRTFGCENPITSIGEFSNSYASNYNTTEIGNHGANLPTLLLGKKGIYTIVTNSSWASGHCDMLFDNATCFGYCNFSEPETIYYCDVWDLQ